jgi:hypothetical protein
MVAHPIATYNSFRTVRGGATPYGNKLENALRSVRMALQSPYGRGSLMSQVVLARGLALAAPTVGAFRTGLAAESGAARTVLSGHGGLFEGAGEITVPEGTSFTTWTAQGNTITDALGNAIETGRPITYAEFGNEIVGARTYLSGSSVPNYTLFPPGELNIMGNPTIVTQPTQLGSLLAPNEGNFNWAACLSEL